MLFLKLSPSHLLTTKVLNKRKHRSNKDSQRNVGNTEYCITVSKNFEKQKGSRLSDRQGCRRHGW